MANASLAYEILLYLNSFYFGMFAACEIGMGVLKGINLNYSPKELQTDACILVAILIIETIRVYFGRKGSLSEHGKRSLTRARYLHIHRPYTCKQFYYDFLLFTPFVLIHFKTYT